MTHLIQVTYDPKDCWPTKNFIHVREKCLTSACMPSVYDIRYSCMLILAISFYEASESTFTVSPVTTYVRFCGTEKSESTLYGKSIGFLTFLLI